MVSPTINFSGNCYEAMTFYEMVFNAVDKQVQYYRDAPPNSGISITDDMKDLVMHASMTICETPFNFSDMQEKADAGNMICFNLFFKTADEVGSAFHKLKEGGNVIVELGPQFFSNMYGSVVDRFGIKWQLISWN